MQSPLRDVLTDKVFQELGDKRAVVLTNALPSQQWQSYLGLAQHADQQGLFRPAQIVGNSQGSILQPEIRGDRILWLEESLASGAATATTAEIFEFLKTLQESLNRSLYVGLTHFECHFACYEPGKGYETHIDQRQNSASGDSERVISFVLYLNSNWQKIDGGQLELELSPAPIVVEPQGGTLVLFDSSHVPHRVLASTTRDRWSLTGWFRRWSNLEHARRR